MVESHWGKDVFVLSHGEEKGTFIHNNVVHNAAS